MRHGPEAPQNFGLAFTVHLCAPGDPATVPSFSTPRVLRFIAGCCRVYRLAETRRALADGGVAASVGLVGKEDFENGKTKYAT
jgi:hypothetical protein